MKRLTALLVSVLFASPIWAEHPHHSPSWQEMKNAAAQCGMKVKIERLPEAIARKLPNNPKYTLDFGSNPSPAQRGCYNSKIPTMKVGYISELPMDAKN